VGDFINTNSQFHRKKGPLKMTSDERHLLGQHAEHDRSDARHEESGAAVELRQEELAARKQTIEAGRVALGTQVVEEEQSLQVPVVREEVTIERRPVAREASGEPISADDEVLSVPVREERVSVDKQPVIYEEVNLATRGVEETQHVTETVRKEVVDVDAIGDVDVSWRENDRR
jgi:uncharacterized protein (TIGR02271 family)